VREKLERHGIKAPGDKKQIPFGPDDFAGALGGLSESMVDEAAYIAAASAGLDAVGHTAPVDREVDPYALGQAQARYRAQYAAAVPGRIAADLSDFMNSATGAPKEGESLDAIMERVKAKIDAIGTDVTRYASPPWTSGWQGYGTGLNAFDIKLVWVCNDDDRSCEDCPQLEADGPYEVGQLPTWPGGDVQCTDNCRCHIEPDEQDWNDVFGQNAA